MASFIEMETGQTDELVGLDAESYTPTYKEALETTPTTLTSPSQKKDVSSWETQGTQASPVTQIFTVPLEEPRYREMNEQIGEGELTQICRLVMEETGSSIQFSLAKDQSPTFVLTGKPDMVQKTRCLILEQMQTKYTVELKILKEHHHFVLGQKYQHLKQLELSTSTKIIVPKSDDPSDVIKIDGTKDNVEKARHEIQLISDERAKLAFERVNIPKWFHPWISGNWLRQAQSETGARINIPPPSVLKDEITIAGEKEAVSKAKAMVIKTYQEKERRANSVSMEVKKSQHKYVCGPKRINLQEILDQFDVSVEVPPLDGPSETITLRGEPHKLALASKIVYEKANSVVTVGVSAPRWLHRFIIGRKGQNINKITQDLPNVYIEFNSDEDQIQVEGPRGEVEQARASLDSYTRTLMETMDYAIVNIDQMYHRHISSNVNCIKRETGTSIMIPSDQAPSRSIRIEGSLAGVAQAKKELLKLATKMDYERVHDVKSKRRLHHDGTQRQGVGGSTFKFPDSQSGSDIVSLKRPQATVEECYKKINVAAKYVAKVRVFKRFHENVIGKGGAVITKICAETQTEIDVPMEDSDSDVIIVTGKKEDVEEARKRIEAIQNEQEQATIVTVVVSIPPKLQQAMIGTKGRLLQSISDECGGVFIGFQTGKQVQAVSDIVIVKGRKDDVKNAKKQLLELANKMALENFSAKVKAKPEYHRYLIGRGGTKFKQLRDETGARIIFPSEKDDDRSLITILGKEDSVKKAKERLVKELENISEAKVIVPHKFHRQFVMRQGQVLQDLADQFGSVSISFPKSGSTSEEVVLKGAKDCVDGAKARIIEIVEELDSQVTIECENLQKHHQSVLGAKGANVQQIGSNFGININGQRMIFVRTAAISGQIDQEGGSLALTSYGLSLTIPPGAITETLLDVTLSLYVSNEAMNLEGRMAHVGLIELLPHKAAFSKPVILKYKLRHHYKPGDDCIETEYGLFYGEGTDPSETYDFIGSLGTEHFQSRHVSYKATMDVYLRDDCLELSTKTFCRFCTIVAAVSFQVVIGFFVRPKGVYKGKRRWDIRITISCTCPKNLEKIQEEMKARKFSLADTKRLRCKEFSFNGRQRVEFSLSEDDEFTSESKFSLRSKKEFSGEDLRFVVENNDPLPSYLDRDCTLKCPDSEGTQAVTFVYHYYKSLPPFSQEDLVSWDDVSVVLQDDAFFDYRSSDSDVFSNDTSQTAKSSGGDESFSSRDASSEAESAEKSSIFGFKVQACDSSSSHATDQSNESELVNMKRKPTTEELQDVSDRLVKDWKRVARRLCVDEKEIERIESNEKYNDAREKPYQMLLYWMESKSESATVDRLCQALRKEQKNDTVSDVFGNVPE